MTFFVDNIHSWQPSKRIEVCWDDANHESWLLDGCVMSSLVSHLNFRQPGEEIGKQYQPDKIEQIGKTRLKLASSTPFGDYQAEYIFDDNTVRIAIKFKFQWTGGEEWIFVFFKDQLSTNAVAYMI